jgi:tetratricopeptide (TPR) repeat protein
MRPLAAFLALAALCGPALAADAPAPDLAKMSNADLAALLNSYDKNGLVHACTEALPVLEEFARRAPEAAVILRGREVARMYCADESGDPEKALTHLYALEENYDARGLDAYALYLASRTDDGPLALSRLRLLSRNKELAAVPKEAVFAAVRGIRRANMLDELGTPGLEVARSDGVGALPPEVQATFGGPALRSAALAGDLPKVEKLLPLMNSPNDYLDLLKFRDYEKAWSVIEKAAGDHLAKIDDAYIAESRARFAEDEADRDRFGDLARALYYAGRFAETEALVGGWRKSRPDLDKIEEGDAWAMNIEAYALDALGRRGEADAVFDRLATYDPSQYFWVVNFAINGASRLVGQGRSEEGLAATERAREVAEKQGSMYAKMLVARDRACALIRLGRQSEADSELDYLRKNSKEGIESAAEGLLCAGLDDEAAALISKALDDPVLRYQALASFPGPQFDLFYTPSNLPHLGEFILARPDLREKALRLARIIPDRFVPEAQLKRKELTGG